MEAQDYNPYIPENVDQEKMLPNQNNDFLKWIYDDISDLQFLRYTWRGYEIDEKGEWKKPKIANPLMNERGISWASSMIQSFLQKSYKFSTFGENEINFYMRGLCRVIHNNLSSRYKEFDINKLDISRIWYEIWTKIHAILLSSSANGNRNFLSTTSQYNYIAQSQQEEKKSNLLNMIPGMRK